MLAIKRSAGVAPEVNLNNPLSVGDEAYKPIDPPWLWSPGQTSLKVQTGISVAPQKGLMSSNFITSRKWGLRRLCFYTCLSFSSQGGCLPHCMLGYTPPPPGQTPPWADTPPRQTPPGRHLPGLGLDTPHGPGPGHPPWADTPLGLGLDTPWADTLPWADTPPPADGYWCGRYASYWNAFMYFKIITKRKHHKLDHTSIKANCNWRLSFLVSATQTFWR